MRKSHRWAPEAPGPIIVPRPSMTEDKGFVAGLLGRMRRARRSITGEELVHAKASLPPSAEAAHRS